MATVQIPQLPAAIGVDGTEELESVQGGVSVRVTSGQIASLATGGSFLVPQSPNTVLAGPASGSAALPTFRTLVAADIPTIENDKLADVPTQTFKSRTSAGTGAPEDLTATQATAILNAFVGDSGSGGTKGMVPAPATGDAASGKFLSASGSWTVPGGGGTVTTVSIATANGFAGTVANATTTPQITLRSTVVGLLQSDGTTLSAALLNGTGGEVVLDTGATLTTPDIGDATGTSLNLSGLSASMAVATDASKTLVSVATTGSGNVVLATSPTLTTPTIGAASGTSLNLSGLTASSAVATDASKNLVSVANTGSGNNVLATSPTLTTPALGTPSSVVLTSATGLPLTTGVTGTLGATNGGTGVNAYASGDILYASSANTLSRLAKASNGNVLSLVSGLPAWSAAGSTAGALVNIQAFTSSGTYTPTAGATTGIVFVTGGGGGSGGVTTGTFQGSGAGGAGATAITFLSSLSSQTITIGAGGTAGPSGSNAGGNGGTTSYGSLVTAGGGTGGAAGSGTVSVGGAGSNTTTGATLTIAGGDGATANVGFGGSGNGGGSFWGTGGGQVAATANANGSPGVAWGSGAGGNAHSTTAANAGAAGAAGVVLIFEFK